TGYLAVDLHEEQLARVSAVLREPCGALSQMGLHCLSPPGCSLITKACQ
ncbi:hypothetical protein GBAR_LOCUS23640, partial [Geodia barretti]